MPEFLKTRHFPCHDHVLPPVEKCVQRKVDGERESGDKDYEPEEPVVE